MHVLLVTPAAPKSLVGNRITALRMAELLEGLGHTVDVRESFEDLGADLVIALHAAKSAAAVSSAVERGLPCALVLTGTDVNVEALSPVVERSLSLATRLVVLYPQGGHALPAAHRSKVRVVIQSASAAPPAEPDPEHFDVCVLAHARPVKDPLLAARAARLAPAESRLRVRLVGGALDEASRREVEREAEQNPRFEWLGLRSHEETQSILTASKLLVLSSRAEGGPAAISEALANGVPVLATRIPAMLGLLGTDHPGLYAVGDHTALAQLCLRSESDPVFLAELRQRSVERQGLVSCQREASSLQRLLEELVGTSTPAG